MQNDQITKIYSGLTSIFLLLACAFIIFPGTKGYEQIQSAKYYSFLAIFGGYVVVTLLIKLEFLFIGRTKLIPIKTWWQELSITQKLVCGYLLMTAVSTILSPYKAFAFLGMTRDEGFITILLYGVSFFLVSKYASFGKKQYVMIAICISLFCILAILQLAGLNPLNLYPIGTSYYNANVDYAGEYISTIGNVDLAAGLLCLMFPLFLKDLRTWPVSALILGIIITIKVSAGIVAIIVGTIVMLPFFFEKSRRKNIWLLLIVIVISALVIVYFVSFKSGTLYEIHEILHGHIDDKFGNGRILIWRQVLQKCKGRILFGYGPDTMAAANMQGYDLYVHSLKDNVYFIIDVAHNEYINILYSQGIMALLFYISALIFTAIRCIKNQDNKEIVLLSFSVLLYLIQAFFGFSMCSVAPFFWIVLGILEKQLNEQEVAKCSKN